MELTGACPNGSRNVLRDLKPVNRFDYAELWRRQGTGKFQTLLAYGTPCASATDQAACHVALGEAANIGSGSACRSGNCGFRVVISDAGGVTRLASNQDVARFLGPIDTPGEALLMALANEHWVLSCDAPPPRSVGPSWLLVSNEMVEDCPVVTADVSLTIAADGTVGVVGTANRKKTGMCVGRRPAGFEAPRAAGSSSALSAYLESCAHLEAASVPAFEHLAKELSRLGAPRALSRRCQVAAREERRHARLMRGLATSFGSDVARLKLPRPRRQTTETLAIDNAMEGCVRETFGAAVGLYQARHAKDPRVRAVLETIAKDEICHAELAWRIAGWAERQLDLSAKRRVTEARQRAIEALRAELQIEADPELSRTLGLPSAHAALKMLGFLEETLWHERD